MRKTFIAFGIFSTVNLTPTPISIIAAHTQQEIPAYAKWGKLAIKETQLKYPNANIIDYLHEGSKSKKGLTIENFKLWLKDGDTEFGVFIKIEYITKTEKVVNIEFEETFR